MIPDFAARLQDYAAVLVRVGVNLQPGQPLLISEPYEQLGVARSAEVIVDAVRRVAAALDSEIDVQWCEPTALRQWVERDDRDAFAAQAGRVVRHMERHVAAGGALLFLTGSQPRLLAGLPAERVAAFNHLNWQVLGPLVQRLMVGATQWSLAPAPSPTWAALTFADLPSDARLAALWHAVFGALRADGTGSAITAWREHLMRLEARAAVLNAARHRRVQFRGAGTDLTVELPSGHRWCTAQITSERGVPFVANLPTEEVFTAPGRDSAHGRLRVARPVVHAGSVISGIELEFEHGRVVRSHADAGAELLAHLLATDDGAARLGEIALVGTAAGVESRGWQEARNLYHHTLLDENAAMHVALGESYPFCHEGWWKRSLNRSAVHVDLPLAADATLV